MKGLRYIFALAALSSGSMLFGQGVVEALKYSQQDIRGTARYMGMAGAFGALGGDITTLSQNPAGIGVYRNNDVAVTLDLSNQASTAQTTAGGVKDNRFKTSCNNFGFVWTMRFNKSALKNLNFGFAYNKQKSFDRNYKAAYKNINQQSSLSNYIAQCSNGYSQSDLTFVENKYDPYFEPDIKWLSILGYDGCLINPIPSTAPDRESREWSGIVGPQALASGDLYVKEKGSIDEYNFNMGGNIYNVLYWGVGVTVTDFSYDMKSGYGENFINGFNSQDNSLVNEGWYMMQNYLHTNGTGIKANMGVILRVTNDLRLGLAFHTPNYYKMTDTYSASVSNNFGEVQFAETLDGTYTYEFQSPWRLSASAAYVFGHKGIISLDYEYTAGDQMSFDDDYSVNIFYQTNQDIANIVAPMHTLKVGAEFMFTRQFSGRLGYAYQTSPVKSAYRSGQVIPTTGTTTIYTLDKETNYITVGLGYRFSNVYLDAAYVYRQRNSDMYPFSPLFSGGDNSTEVASPQVAKQNDHNSSYAITLGVKL